MCRVISYFIKLGKRKIKILLKSILHTPSYLKLFTNHYPTALDTTRVLSCLSLNLVTPFSTPQTRVVESSRLNSIVISFISPIFSGGSTTGEEDKKDLK